MSYVSFADSHSNELQSKSPPVEVVVLLMGSYEGGEFSGDMWLRAKFKNNTAETFSSASVYITAKEFKMVPAKDKDHTAHPDIGFIVLSPDLLSYPSETRPWKPGETLTLTRTYQPIGVDSDDAKDFQQWDRDMFEYFTVKLKLQANELMNVTHLVSYYWADASPSKWK